MLSYVANHSKQRKTTKVIKLQWIASIWCQKHQTNAKLQKWSYFDEFASIWRQNDQNNAKLQTRLNYDEFASIWHQNYQKCWGTSKNIQNKAKLRKWSNYNELHRFDVKTFKTFALGRKTTKVIKLQWIASIWHQNNQKCWVTS